MHRGKTQLRPSWSRQVELSLTERVGLVFEKRIQKSAVRLSWICMNICITYDGGPQAFLPPLAREIKGFILASRYSR
jgi:hypothetical protein